MSPRTSCREWLATSKAARNAYLLKNWPNLRAEQVVTVVHEQSLGCEVEPSHRTHTAMGTLQAPVEIVVLGFSRFYEAALAEGSRQSPSSFFEDGVLGALHMKPAKKPPP